MAAASRLVPLWLKIAYTAFMAVLIPVYLKNYGPTNFLYFCDVVAIMTILAIWIESPLLLSAALIGSFLGARRLPFRAVQISLGCVLLIAAAKNLLG